MIRSLRSVGMGLAVLLVPGAVMLACGGGSQQPPAAGGTTGGAVPMGSTAEEWQGPEADSLRTYHRHHHIGFIGFVLISIPSLGLPPAEEAKIEAIRADMKTKFQPARDAEAALLAILADGIAAGNIDMTKVDPAVAKIAEVSTQMDDVTNDDLNQIHALLTPPEREALALKVQANYMVWERANADRQAQPDQEKEGGHIHHLAKVLAMTPDQIEKTDAAFTASIADLFATRKYDPKAAEQHLNAFLDTFPTDKFDAKTLTTADSANSSVTGWGAMRMVRMYQAMTPVLTPDQRTKLAAMLRETASKQEIN